MEAAKNIAKSSHGISKALYHCRPGNLVFDRKSRCFIDQVNPDGYRLAIHICIDFKTISYICLKTGAHFVIKVQLFQFDNRWNEELAEWLRGDCRGAQTVEIRNKAQMETRYEH